MRGWTGVEYHESRCGWRARAAEGGTPIAARFVSALREPDARAPCAPPLVPIIPERVMFSRTRLLVPAMAALILAAGACADKGKNGTLAQDSTLTRDLQMANADSAAQPQLQDVPAAAPAQPKAEAPAPRRETPRPRPRSTGLKPVPTPAQPAAPITTPSGNTEERAPKGSEAALATVPAGTVIGLASNDRVCTNTNKVGDRFTATVNNAVTADNGTVIPAGAKAVIEVTNLKRSGNANEPIEMTFRVVSLNIGGTAYPVTGTIDHMDVQKVRTTSTGTDAKKVVGGAVIGAIIGQIIGHNTKGTVIGAATGAAAGTAVAMGTADYEGCLPQGGNIQMKLTEPAAIQVQ